MKNQNTGRLEEKEKLLNKRCHAELVSASSTQAVLKQQQQASKILNQVQDDFINNTTASGFTLIELLVVVLIIGILAAVAVPQYQTAVLKSRFTAFLPLLRSLKEAQELYYMENGEYAVSLLTLDIQMPESCSKVSQGSGNMWYCGKAWLIDNGLGNNKPMGYIQAYFCPDNTSISDYSSCVRGRVAYIAFHYDQVTSSTLNPNNAGKVICTGHTSSGKQLCKTFLKN